jgi:hypothetical protein
MENNFNNRDFEQFVKENADQYRMFPSEKVWNGIHSALHTRRKWYGLGLVLLFLTASTVTWVMFAPGSVKQIASKQVNTPNIENNNVDQKIVPAIRPLQSSAKNNVFPLAGLDQENLLTLNGITNLTENNNTIENKAADVISNKPININITDQATDNNLTYEDKIILTALSTEKRDNYPLSIESIINLFKAKNKRISYQLYFTPTVSYRKLQENKSYTQSTQLANAPLRFSAASSKDINNVVTHKPALGFELGLSVGYKLSENLKIKAGVQFNVSRYEIKAFTSGGEIATIALNRGNDSINTWTNHRNFDGYKSDWLQNLYFSISAPVGIELKIAGDNKTHLGISGTLQPTYILSDKAYLISSDYTNYAEVPSLIRRWNLNTSIEPYVGYSTGKLNWQIGPQVRYQLLSSFQKKYPVKENLFDFGLRVGIMLNK